MNDEDKRQFGRIFTCNADDPETISYLLKYWQALDLAYVFADATDNFTREGLPFVEDRAIQRPDSVRSLPDVARDDCETSACRNAATCREASGPGNTPEKPVDLPAQDSWRARLEMARLWQAAVNKHGGDVTLVHLPKLGIKGNTHFPFSDLNNVEIADLVSKFLADKRLD